MLMECYILILSSRPLDEIIGTRPIKEKSKAKPKPVLSLSMSYWLV